MYILMHDNHPVCKMNIDSATGAITKINNALKDDAAGIL